MQSSTRTISEIIHEMQQLVPPGSPPPADAAILTKLRQLTQELIRAYKSAGRLQEDPFFEAWTRPLHLYETEVRQHLQNQTVLVTGGEGYVGHKLLNQLLELGVARVVSIDFVRGTDGSAIAGSQPNVQLYAADIRDYDTCQRIFATEKPAIVFHVAAQRQPGLAEKVIRESVTSNVFGTVNVIRLCEAFRVQQCIFSSTGKASRYFTAEVYAASKKVAEWLFGQAVQTGQVQYGMVRFTHMLENSLMNEQIGGKVQRGELINIHAPDRYVTGQNVGEAVNLLLNALIFSERDRLKFLLVRNLGWPTESLEVALHKIMESGQELPIYFQGIQPGYEESFFLGQVDWDDQIDINTLINALETGYNATTSSSGDMIVADLVPFSANLLSEQLVTLKALCDDRSVPEPNIKTGLAQLVWHVGASSFRLMDAKRALQILKWGVNPKRFHSGEFKPESYQDIIGVVLQGLVDRLTPTLLTECNLSASEVEEILQVVDTVPALKEDVARLRAAVQQASNDPVGAGR